MGKNQQKNAMNKDLKEKVVYLIGYERAEGRIVDLTPEELSERLGVSVDEINEVLKELGLI